MLATDDMGSSCSSSIVLCCYGWCLKLMVDDVFGENKVDVSY